MSARTEARTHFGGVPRVSRRQLEAKLRHVVVDRLGIDPESLAPGISLVDDLAADSLDFAEIAVAVDEELGIVLERSALDVVRSFNDLVEVVLTRQSTVRPDDGEHPVVRVRIGAPAAVVERVLTLTPYAAELIASDVLRAGPGVTLEVTVLGDDDEAGWRSAAAQLSRLAARGVVVHLVRDARRPARRYAGPAARRGPTWGRAAT